MKPPIVIGVREPTLPRVPHYTYIHEPTVGGYFVYENDQTIAFVFTETYARAIVWALATARSIFAHIPLTFTKSDAVN